MCGEVSSKHLQPLKYFLEESSLPYLCPLPIDSYYIFYPYFQSFIAGVCFVLSHFKSILNVWIFFIVEGGF